MRRVILLLTVMAATLVLASGVALALTKIGTNGPDTLRGTNGNDNLLGKGGNDRLFALNGRDTLLGGPGNDIVIGGWGSDNVVGEEGNDLLFDGPDRDVALDKLSGGAGTDVIGVASLRLKATAADIVTCGSGFDRVVADTKDVVAPDCEKVDLFRGGTRSEYNDLLNEFFSEVPPSFFEGLPPGAL